MATYTVVPMTGPSASLYHGTSINKAKKICDESDNACVVLQFVKYNKPMPAVYWNSRFRNYVEDRGNECYEGMTRW